MRDVLRFRRWPVKETGNEHFSAIFLDEGRPAGLHLCMSKFVPLWSVTWHWCDLTFVEPLVVKLDYGKMSASDLSSLEIALWYLELQEMI